VTKNLRKKDKNVEQDSFILTQELLEDKSTRKKFKFWNVRVVNNRVHNFRKSKFKTNLEGDAQNLPQGLISK
jgi:hypothetical protein